jgi:hypothetical protein
MDSELVEDVRECGFALHHHCGWPPLHRFPEAPATADKYSTATIFLISSSLSVFT